jgi:hypothetical protein
VKDLKAKVEKLEDKGEPMENPDLKEIIEKQRILAELIEANSDRIICIDSEIKDIKNRRNFIPPSPEKDSDENKEVTENNSVNKKCRYNDKGYCKFQKRCRYFHPLEICKIHLEKQKCKDKGCRGRHPKACRWFQRDIGCKRRNCEYLHVFLAKTENEAKTKSKDYECAAAGCKNVWQDTKCVVKQNIGNGEVFLCLNCDDWIVNKSAVLNSDWTLFDQHGNLRQDV